MKKVIAMLLVAVLMVAASCGQSQSKNDEADPFDGAKIVGKKEVTAAIAVTKIPEAYAGFEKGGFAKYAGAFGVHVFGTADARDEKVLHAAKVIAEYLDNDRDGVPDNMWLLSNMISRNATITMPRTQDGFGELDRSQWRGLGHRTQGLWDEESRPGFVNEDGSINREVLQDAALEEIFHLICDTGYSKAYPEAFAPEPGTALAECMDIARAGHFTEVPKDGPKAGYPEEAWYHYDDETCDYGCMAVEYMYWGMTSILGVQEFNYLNRPAGGEGPSREWEAYTPELMRAMDPCLTDLLTDPKYKLPTKAPDGRYTPSATPKITVPLIAVGRD
jgi:hypothetical protein